MEKDILNFEENLLKLKDERKGIENDASKLTKYLEEIERQVKDSQNEYLGKCFR